MAEELIYNVALKKAMALCAGREMCFYDVRQKLNSWGVSAGNIEKILSQLKEEKFIDELRYASAFTKDKFRYNKWGKLKIRAGLKMKKIPEEIIRNSIGAIDETEYHELLKSLIEKQRKSVKFKNQYDLKGKLMRFGLSKGFESHLLYELLGEDE